MKILVITEKSLIFVMFSEDSTYFTNEFDLFWFPSLRLDLQGAAQITQSFSMQWCIMTADKCWNYNFGSLKYISDTCHDFINISRSQHISATSDNSRSHSSPHAQVSVCTCSSKEWRETQHEVLKPKFSWGAYHFCSCFTRHSYKPWSPVNRGHCELSSK